MNRKVPQKMGTGSTFPKWSQAVAGCRRLSQTGNDLCFHIKFEGAGDRSQAVAGYFTVIWKPGLKQRTGNKPCITFAAKSLCVLSKQKIMVFFLYRAVYTQRFGRVPWQCDKYYQKVSKWSSYWAQRWWSTLSFTSTALSMGMPPRIWPPGGLWYLAPDSVWKFSCKVFNILFFSFIRYSPRIGEILEVLRMLVIYFEWITHIAIMQTPTMEKFAR